MVSPEKAASAAPRRAEVQALIAVVACGDGRGLTGIKIVGQTASTGGEYFLPFVVGGDASQREYIYAGLTIAIDRLRALKIDRVLILLDDEVLVSELERHVEPPRELFLHYVILGCKLNEFRRAKVVSAPSSRLEQQRTKTASLDATVYNAPLLAPAS
jgi:hypothetical protein